MGAADVGVRDDRERRVLEEQERELDVLSVRRLMWYRFRRNKPAIISGIFLIIMYLAAAFAGFVAPYGVRQTHDEFPATRPTWIRFVDAEGNFRRPFVYGLQRSIDLQTFQVTYTTDPNAIYPIRFFAKGEPYSLFGLFQLERHLFLVDEPGKVFLLGTDAQGRDLFSRIIYGAQVSLTVGLLGVFISLLLGSFFGVVTGYYGGLFDTVMQRIIEVLLSFPQIPLWIALAAALPPTWSSIKVFFGITVVLSLVSWGALAREVRAKILALREQDFVVAARLTNVGFMRMVWMHLFPNTLSHVLVVATLAIPAMILGETALSFLGLGIKPPMTSWGVLLSEAQYARVLIQQPWLITPVIFVMATVIAYNFLGDGLRDAADPFAR